MASADLRGNCCWKMGILAVQAGLAYFHSLSFATVGQRSLVDLRRDTYARLISLPMTFFANRRVGELASRLSADLIQIEDTLITILPQFIRQSTILIGGIALIAKTSLKLTGVMLASLPLVIVVAVVFGRKTRKIARDAQDRLADTATIVEETLQGIVNVKAFSNEGYELNRYHEGLGKFLTATLRGARLRATFISFIIFALFGFIIAGVLVGGRDCCIRQNHFQRSSPDSVSAHQSCGGGDGAIRGVIQPASEGHRGHAAGAGIAPGNRRGGRSLRPDAAVHFASAARGRGV